MWPRIRTSLLGLDADYSKEAVKILMLYIRI